MTTFSPVRLTLEEKLDTLRKLDPHGEWESLDDQRYCTRCDHLITGRQIEVAGGSRRHGPLRLECPTSGCAATPQDWASPKSGHDRATASPQSEITPERGARVEIAGESEDIFITHNGHAVVVVRRSRPADKPAARHGAKTPAAIAQDRSGSWLQRSVARLAVDCRALLGPLRRTPRTQLYAFR